MYRYISFITSVAFIDLIMASCPSNSIFDPNRHLCYWPSSDRQSFQEHEVYCEGDNGIVITIDSNQTETFINETIPWDIWFAHDHEPNYDIFIGRIDVFRNKHFYQLESIPLDHTIFSNITSNQDSLDCCILDGSGAPMMDACSAKQQAICSIDASSQSDCPTQGKFYDYRCYWPLTTPDSAENQLVSCSNDSGTLAIFHNLSTIDQVVAEFSNWGLSTPWIGINDLDTEGIYKESFEIKYNTFAPWAQNEPGDITTQRCVERWSKDGFWNDLTCIESKLSICQKRGTMPETTTELSIPSTGSETSTESTTEINTLKTSTGTMTETTTELSTLSTGSETSTESTSEINTLKTSTGTIPETTTELSTLSTGSGTMPKTTTELSTPSTGSETSTESISEINTLKTSTEASTESATTINTLSTSTGSKTCKCTCKTNITISDEELTKKLEEIRKVLLIPKNSTKAFLRSKTSAYEDRPMAKGLGSIGIAIIVIVVTLIVCIDVSSLIAKRGRRLDKE